MTFPVALRRSHWPTLLAALGLLLLLTPTPHARGQAGPIAHWKFDEVAGPTAFDSAGTNHGTLSATGATFVPGGISGNAISLDRAANGLVNMGNVLSLTTGDHSIVAWVKTTPGDITTPLVVVAKHQNGSRNGYALMVNGNGGVLTALNKAMFYEGGTGNNPIIVAETPVSTTSVNDGNWHQIITVVQAGGNKTIYVDGTPVEDSKPTQAFVPNTAAFLIGGTQLGLTPTPLFTGLIDDVQIYDRALSDSEIALLFRSPGSEAKAATGGKCLAAPPGLVSMWPFEGNAMDAMGTNHGTLVGSPTFAPGQVNQAIYVTNTVGFTNYVMVPAAPSLNVGAGPGMSIEGWITPTDLQTFQPLVEWNRNIPVGFNTMGAHFWINVLNGSFVPGGGPGALYINLIDANNLGHVLHSMPGDLTSNVFNHVAMTYDKATGLAKLFVNGLRVAQTNLGSFTPQTSYDLYFAKRPAANTPIVNQSFTGALDELSLYDRALTDAEVQAIAQAGSLGKYTNCAPVLLTKCSAAPPGLVSMWPFDGNARDAAGTNHGTLIGSPGFSAGKVDQAIYLTNNIFPLTNFVFVPASPSLDVGTGPGMTIEAWINPTDLQTNQPLVEWNRGIQGAPNTIGALFWINVLNGSFVTGGGPGSLCANLIDINNSFAHILQSAPGVLNSNAFNHVAMTYDRASGILKLFAHGAVVAQTNVGSITPQTTYDLYIGKRPGANIPIPNQSYNGALDEVSLYNRALSDVEINTVFLAGSQGKYQTCSTNGITSQPADSTVTAGTTATFSVGVNGTPPMGYQWTHNGINLPGATANSLTIYNASFTNAGTYAVRVLYPSGSLMSGNATLTVFYPLPVITSLSPSQTATLGGSVSFSVTATGPGPLSYLWRKEGINIPGATNSNLGLTGIQAADGGAYQAVVSNPGGAVVSTNIVLSIAGAPVITTQPAGQVIALGSAVSFNVTASGTAPLAYQWRFNRADLPGETNATLSLASAQVPNAGLYSVVVSNLAGVARSAGAELRFIGGPVITSQPAGRTVPAGSNVVLSVAAVGDPTLTYQWRLDGVPILGATGADLLFGSPQFTNSGIYSVVVTNNLGAVVSSNAVLTVAVPLAITQQPSNQVSTAGGSVQFGVGAVGTPPLTYQWRYNGNDLPGETSGSLLLRTLQLSQSGGYSVVVRDAFNSVTSSIANLLVAPALPSVVLFDGTDTLKWTPLGGTGAVAWPIIAASNALEVAVGAGGIQSTQNFTDFNLHLEFRTPNPTDANRGNSGILLQNRYEIQIFESFGRAIVATNDCGAILGQRAPRANATLAAGQWQTYDITFHAAQFNGTNKVANARATVTLNGVIVQDDVSITGPTAGGAVELPLAGPIVLTDDGSRVQFRNIRVTPLDAAPDFAWVRAEAGRNANGLVRGLRVDRRGNVYATGTYDGTPTFGATNLTSLPGSPISTFVAKYDFNGNLLWVRGSGTASPCKALDLEIDTAGSVYVTGVLTRPDTVFGVVFGGGVNAAQDSYVAKFDTDGHLLWITATDGPGDSYAGNIAVDTAGNSYFVGSVGQSKTLGSLSIPSGGAYTAKLDPSGVPLWFHADSGAVANGVALNHLNEVLVTGYFRNQGTIGGVRFNLPRSDQGIFLEKLSNSGIPIWVKIWSATASFLAEQIAVDTTDNIVITGKFQGTATFGTNVLATDTVAAFAAKCDRAGNLTWVRQIDNSGDTRFRGSVATDGANNIYVGLTPFGAVQTGTATLPGFGGNDALVVKYNSSGTMLWAVEAGGVGDDIERAVAVDFVGNVYLGGEFSGNGTFGTTNVVSRGAADIFVAKLGNTPLPVDAGAQQAPYIVIQPSDASTIVDAEADFIAIAGGSAPLSYQWRLDGTDVPGATNAFLILNAVQFTNAGVYTLSVTNAFGSVISSNATLFVRGLPVIVTQPQDQSAALGGSVTFSVDALGTAPLSYLWRFNGLNIPGATNPVLLLANLQAADAGLYRVIVANAAGVALSSEAVLRIAGAPQFVSQPGDQVLAVGSGVTLSASVTGDAPLSYQWQLDGVDLPGQTSSDLALPSVQRAQVGTYTLRVSNFSGQTISRPAVVRLIGGPVIVTQPRSQSVPVGSSVTLNVGVLGDAPLAYQWRFNGAAISGETGQSLTLAQVPATASGSYSVVVTNSLGLATSTNAALTVYVPLAIISQPVSQVIAIGGSARFSVGVVGVPPFAYQWLFNGNPITNATLPDFQLGNVQPADSGGYSVVVTDSLTTITSSVAGLQVFEPLPSFVLFDGTDTSKFVSSVNGGPIQWPIVAPNILEVVPGTGSIQSTQTFTDFKLHLEFRTPGNPRDPVGGTRGNSGVYVQGRYEIQIFDSFGTLVPDANDCGAIWGQTPPRVNACLAPGQWQTYDITFHAPQWNGNTKVRDAHATVVLNGVIVQDDVLIPRITQGGRIAEGPTAGPILLQDNGSRVQFRNVVVTPLDTSPTFTWGVSGGGSTLGDDPFGDLTVDSSGFSYFAAMYRGDLTVGTNVLAATTTRNGVFGKLDPSGRVVWLRRASSGLPHVNYGKGVAVDGQGNVFGVGTCERYISFLGQQYYPDGTDAFLAKYDSAGNEVWIRTGGTAVAADGTGNSYTAGDGSAVLTFGSTVLPAGAKGFVAKYDRNGNVVWVTSYSGATTTASVRVDGGGNVYVGGSFTGTVTFGTQQLTSVGQSDAFIAKLDSSGRFVWVRRFGGTGGDGVSALALDPRGNLFAAGTFQATVTIGTNTLFKASNSEGVLVKYDASGNVLWARQTGGTSQKQMDGLAVDAAGGAYIVGSFVGPATFSSRGVTPSTNVYDVFVAKYDTVGDFVWARSAGGTGDKFGLGVGVDASGNVFVGGDLTSSIVLDAQTLTTSGAPDFFVAKLGDNRVFLQGPLISVQPLTQDVGEGVTVVFAPTVGGPEPLTYQWRLNGTNLPGATNVNLLLNAAGPLDAGVYTLFVTNQYGAVLSSNAVLTVLGVPVVTLQPQDQQLHVGEDLNLRADAAGTPPVSYLWRFNGVNIPGATNLTLRVPNVTTNEAGEYFVIVSNPAGVALSQKAFVSVNPAPFVRLSPQDQSVALGTTAMLGVQLLGQPPFTYQWLFNRAALPGQTGATLSLAGVQPAQAGRYSVAVTNAFGGVVSPEAELTIIRPAFTFGRATNGSGGLALSFPPEATGFVLESSPTLGAGAVWTVVTNFVTLPNGQIILPIDPAGGPRYFRLRTP